MTLETTTLSLMTGAVTGILYGLFFLLQRRRVFFAGKHSERRQFSLAILFAIVRIMLLAIFWYYVLLSPSINFILLVISFLGAFWLTILLIKA